MKPIRATTWIVIVLFVWQARSSLVDDARIEINMAKASIPVSEEHENSVTCSISLNDNSRIFSPLILLTNLTFPFYFFMTIRAPGLSHGGSLCIAINSTHGSAVSGGVTRTLGNIAYSVYDQSVAPGASQAGKSMVVPNTGPFPGVPNTGPFPGASQAGKSPGLRNMGTFPEEPNAGSFPGARNGGAGPKATATLFDLSGMEKGMCYLVHCVIEWCLGVGCECLNQPVKLHQDGHIALPPKICPPHTTSTRIPPTMGKENVMTTISPKTNTGSSNLIDSSRSANKMSTAESNLDNSKILQQAIQRESKMWLNTEADMGSHSASTISKESAETASMYSP